MFILLFVLLAYSLYLEFQICEQGRRETIKLDHSPGKKKGLLGSQTAKPFLRVREDEKNKNRKLLPVLGEQVAL